MRKTLAASMLGMAAVSLSVPALSAPGQNYINLGAGIQSFEDAYNLDSTETAILGWEHQFSQRWGLELKYMFSAPENSANNAALDTDLHQVGLDALYYLGDGQGWEPYLALGMGYAQYDFDGGTTADDTQANFGGGVRYLITDRLSLRGDLRYIHGFEDNLGAGLVSFGATVALGKLKSAAPAPAPAPQVMDADGDGVADKDDKCANTPAGVAVNASGCPLDKDGDGVPNYRDKCPATPAGRKVDEFGCKYVLKRTEQIEMKVNFALNSAEVTNTYSSEIEKVAAFLKKFGGVKAVIEGHSDSSGAADYNKSLSQRRADAVKALLVSKYGIAASRLTAVGYGEERPVASNDTAEGRKANRRVVAVMKAEVSE